MDSYLHYYRHIIKVKFKENIEKAMTKSKINFLITNKQEWKPMQRPPYMNELRREDIATIFKARTRMLDIKNNFRGKYQDSKCRGCGIEIETQDHVLTDCKTIHQNNNTKVPLSTIFTENTKTLKKTAKKIREAMIKLLKSDANPL